MAGFIRVMEDLESAICFLNFVTGSVAFNSQDTVVCGHVEVLKRILSEVKVMLAEIKG